MQDFYPGNFRSAMCKRSIAAGLSERSRKAWRRSLLKRWMGDAVFWGVVSGVCLSLTALLIFIMIVCLKAGMGK